MWAFTKIVQIQRFPKVMGFTSTKDFTGQIPIRKPQEKPPAIPWKSVRFLRSGRHLGLGDLWDGSSKNSSRYDRLCWWYLHCFPMISLISPLYCIDICDIQCQCEYQQNPRHHFLTSGVYLYRVSRWNVFRWTTTTASAFCRCRRALRQIPSISPPPKALSSVESRSAKRA